MAPPDPWLDLERSNSILAVETSGIGWGSLELAQFVTHHGHGFLRGPYSLIVGEEGPFVDGKRHQEFSAVEIILLVTRQPHTGRHFVSFLHEIAALINFGKKQGDGNVFGDVSLDFG